MFDGMKYRTLTLPILLGIVLFFAAYLAWPKANDSSKPSQQKFVPMSVATPHRERTKLQPQKEGPIKVSFKLKPSFVDPESMKKG